MVRFWIWTCEKKKKKKKKKKEKKGDEQDENEWRKELIRETMNRVKDL